MPRFTVLIFQNTSDKNSKIMEKKVKIKKNKWQLHG